LDLDQSALDWLAHEGYDSVYGARPLKRVIQRSVQNKLATLLLEGSIHENETIHVTAGAEGLVIGGQLAQAA
jgi:ATP-dependent Clp protease ATP-binding subunit ClpB